MTLLLKLVAVATSVVSLVALSEGQTISCYSCDWDQISGCQSKSKLNNNHLLSNCTVCQKVQTPYVTGLAAAKGKLSYSNCVEYC